MAYDYKQEDPQPQENLQKAQGDSLEAIQDRIQRLLEEKKDSDAGATLAYLQGLVYHTKTHLAATSVESLPLQQLRYHVESYETVADINPAVADLETLFTRMDWKLPEDRPNEQLLQEEELSTQLRRKLTISLGNVIVDMAGDQNADSALFEKLSCIRTTLIPQDGPPVPVSDMVAALRDFVSKNQNSEESLRSVFKVFPDVRKNNSAALPPSPESYTSMPNSPRDSDEDSDLDSIVSTEEESVPGNISPILQLNTADSNQGVSETKATVTGNHESATTTASPNTVRKLPSNIDEFLDFASKLFEYLDHIHAQGKVARSVDKVTFQYDRDHPSFSLRVSSEAMSTSEPRNFEQQKKENISSAVSMLLGLLGSNLNPKKTVKNFKDRNHAVQTLVALQKTAYRQKTWSSVAAPVKKLLQLTCVNEMKLTPQRLSESFISLREDLHGNIAVNNPEQDPLTQPFKFAQLEEQYLLPLALDRKKRLPDTTANPTFPLLLGTGGAAQASLVKTDIGYVVQKHFHSSPAKNVKAQAQKDLDNHKRLGRLRIQSGFLIGGSKAEVRVEEIQNCPYFETKYIKNTPPRNTDEAIDFAVQVFKLLEAIHDNGYVLGDINATTFLRDPEGKAWLVDAGEMTKIGTLRTEIAATHSYQPMLRQEESAATPQQDVYAAALLIADMFSGGAVIANRQQATSDWVIMGKPPNLTLIDQQALPIIEILEKACGSQYAPSKEVTATTLKAAFEDLQKDAAQVSALGNCLNPALANLKADNYPTTEMSAAVAAQATGQPTEPQNQIPSPPTAARNSAIVLLGMGVCCGAGAGLIQSGVIMAGIAGLAIAGIPLAIALGVLSLTLIIAGVVAACIGHHQNKTPESLKNATPVLATQKRRLSSPDQTAVATA